MAESIAQVKRPVTFKIVRTKDSNDNTKFTTSEPFIPAYHDGQIIFVEDTQQLYLDFHAKRLCYSGSGAVVESDPDALHYAGISEIDPKPGTAKVGGKTLTASEANKNKVVVYSSKEFVCRKDDEGNWGWFELGDEDAVGAAFLWDEEDF